MPFNVRPSLVAAFNSGFKLQDSHGGYVAEGRQAPGHPLINGQASLIIRTNGSPTVGMWGRDAVAGPDIRAVRQNLTLLIDGGVEAPDLDLEGPEAVEDDLWAVLHDHDRQLRPDEPEAPTLSV